MDPRSDPSLFGIFLGAPKSDGFWKWRIRPRIHHYLGFFWGPQRVMDFESDGSDLGSITIWDFFGGPKEWRILGVTDFGSDGFWEWRILGVTDFGSDGFWEWRILGVTEWRILGVTDSGSDGFWEWRILGVTDFGSDGFWELWILRLTDLSFWIKTCWRVQEFSMPVYDIRAES